VIMITEVMHSNSVLKLKGILEDRYGLGFKIVSMIDASNIDTDQQPIVRKNGSLHVPIIARDKYLGTAIMERADLLSDGDMSAVSEIVRLVLEPALFSFYLSRKTDSLQSEILPENVTLLSNYTPHKVAEDNSWFLNRPEFSVSGVLLESHNPHRVNRAALQVHEIGSRWAYLNWNDVKKDIQKASDFRTMGPMTILVPDVLLLSPEEQSLFADYCLTANSMTEPLVLFGSSRNLFELMEEKLVNEDLGISLMKNRIELDRLPTDFSMLKDALELLLDRKAILN